MRALRAVLGVTGWAALVCCSVVVAARWVGVTGPWWVVQPMSFYPWLLPVFLVLVAAPLLARRWVVAGALVAVLAVGGVPLLDRVDAEAPSATGPTLRVSAFNLGVGGADAAAVVDLASRVDVLVLVEVTDGALTRLAGAGLDTELPHRVVQERPGVSSGGVWSRLPLREVAEPTWSVHAMPLVSLTPPGGERAITLRAVHTWVPLAGQRNWDLELAELAGDRAADVLVGDFNATVDHADFRDLLDEGGYTDAGLATGTGLRPTWPVGGRLPGIVIDHVLTAAPGGARSLSVVEVPGSDHRALVADLVLPQAA